MACLLYIVIELSTRGGLSMSIKIVTFECYNRVSKLWNAKHIIKYSPRKKEFVKVLRYQDDEEEEEEMETRLVSTMAGVRPQYRARNGLYKGIKDNLEKDDKPHTIDVVFMGVGAGRLRVPMPAGSTMFDSYYVEFQVYDHDQLPSEMEIPSVINGAIDRFKNKIQWHKIPQYTLLEITFINNSHAKGKNIFQNTFNDIGSFDQYAIIDVNVTKDEKTGEYGKGIISVYTIDGDEKGEDGHHTTDITHGDYDYIAHS